MINWRDNHMVQVKAGEIALSRDSSIRAESTEVILSSLYEQYYDRIVRYIFVRINDKGEAENLGGDVFLRALQSLGSFRGRTEQMRAWLFKIAHNAVVDYLRKMGKRRNVSIDEVEIPDRLDIEALMETNSEINRLSKALQRLTPAQREVIGLRFFAELSSDEVGKILGKKSGAVREMQSAAIETLRRAMYV
jgi:RNA polymerase sigma-70 factor (ECF subfamily)